MKTLLPLLAVLLLLSGCARGYVLTLNNGQKLRAANKPRLDNGFYYYKDTTGQQRYIFSGKVKEVSPASMANDNKKEFNFLPPQ